MGIPTYQVGAFLRDPARRPDWAQLTRLAGDRAAIRFEALRRAISGIDGLVEELCYDGPDRGWVPRYRVGAIVLASVRISPGALEAAIELDGALRERVLESPRIAGSIKQAILAAPVAGGAIQLRLRLSSLAQVRALARVMLEKSKA